MKFHLSIHLKLILAITLAVAIVAASGGFVTLTSVAALSLRLRSLYDDSVLPLALAAQASEECHEMNLAACRTLTAEGDKRQLAVEQLKQFQNSFERHVAKYASELTVGTQPNMQEMLKKYGALEDQTTREQRALDVVKRTFPVLQRSLDQMFDLLRQGSRREAIAFYDRDLTTHFDALQDSLDVLKHLQLARAQFAEQESQTLGWKASLQTWSVSVIGLFAGIGAGLFFVRAISRKIQELNAATRIVAAGNYHHRIGHISHDELGSLADSFNKMVRTLEQTHQDLKTSKEAADTANRVMNAFLANMNYKIRTPMNGIIGLTGLALETELNSEQHEYLEGVKLSAETLLKVLNAILDFAKIEAENVALERIDFSVRETLESTLQSFSRLAQEKHLELLHEVRPDVPDALIGDPNCLWQVVSNLIDNALKFTQQGAVLVLVEVVERMHDAVSLRFTVSDTGIGVPADKQDKLFRPFIPADDSNPRKYGGIGLGLAISQRLVALMDGRIWFESEEGGSQFHFTAHFGLPSKPTTKPTKLRLAELAGLRVLVVDDDPTSRRILTEQFTRWRMKPTAINSGTAALETLLTAVKAEEPFRLILSELMLPDMDGFTLVEQIHAHPEIGQATIIVLSSTDDQRDITLARQRGAAAYLVKPVPPKELLNAIATTLSLANQHGSAQSGASSVGSNGRALRVLVAEDNALNQLLAKRILEKVGHAVSTANNGEEVLAAVGRDSFDLILMDVQMPVMDGLQATTLIRQRENGGEHHQPIVAMTAHTLKGDRERCLAAGMDGYVSKPIRTSELFAAIAAAVKDTHSPRECQAVSDSGLDDASAGGSEADALLIAGH